MSIVKTIARVAPKSALGALPTLTDHEPYRVALARAKAIAERARPLQEELARLDELRARAVASEKSVKEARRAAVAHAIAGGEPGPEWTPPAESARLKSRAEEVAEKLHLYELAADIHDADSVRPARAEALRLAQVAVVRDHFAPAVVAMLAPLAEFAARSADVARMLSELEAADLDGGPVATPHVPWHLFGRGQDPAAAVRAFARELGELGTIPAADAVALARG